MPQTLSLSQLADRVAGAPDRVRAALAGAAKASEVASTAGVRAGFNTSTAPDGTAWKPLLFRQGKPLLDKGLLAASVSAKADADGLGITLRANAPGAAAHQYGATIVPKRGKVLRFPVGAGKRKRWVAAKRVVVPARPYLGWSQQTLTTIAKIYAARLAKAAL